MKKLLLVLLCGYMSAQQTVRVTHVQDGDTFHSQNQTYRIADIDAPELSQVYGQRSRQYLSRLILNQNVRVYHVTTDRYRRQVVRVKVRNIDVGEKMVSTGQAWWYSYYSSNKKLKYLQDRAKSRKFGLWKYHSIEPSKYRKFNK